VTVLEALVSSYVSKSKSKYAKTGVIVNACFNFLKASCAGEPRTIEKLACMSLFVAPRVRLVSSLKMYKKPTIKR